MDQLICQPSGVARINAGIEGISCYRAKLQLSSSGIINLQRGQAICYGGFAGRVGAPEETRKPSKTGHSHRSTEGRNHGRMDLKQPAPATSSGAGYGSSRYPFVSSTLAPRMRHSRQARSGAGPMLMGREQFTLYQVSADS